MPMLNLVEIYLFTLLDTTGPAVLGMLQRPLYFHVFFSTHVSSIECNVDICVCFAFINLL